MGGEGDRRHRRWLLAVYIAVGIVVSSAWYFTREEAEAIEGDVITGIESAHARNPTDDGRGKTAAATVARLRRSFIRCLQLVGSSVSSDWPAN